MSHNIEIIDGQAGFVSAREDAWHQLGVVLPDTFTAEEAMKAANLGEWNVRKEPLFAEVNGQQLLIPNQYATVRDNPVRKGKVDPLGVVGESYTPIQNEAHAEFLNALVDESGAHFETAGSLEGGKRVFITMKLPGHMLIGGKDAVDTYLGGVNSHDGNSSFTLFLTPVRVVCKNTLNIALGKAQNRFSIRHTSGAKAAVQQAREKLDLMFNYLDAFNTEMEQLIQTTMTQVQFEELVNREFGAPEGAPAATVTRAEQKISQMEWLFAEACTQTDICDTAWAGFNALTEWFDHYSPTKGDGTPEDRRAKNALFDQNFKTKALALVTTAVM